MRNVPNQTPLALTALRRTESVTGLAIADSRSFAVAGWLLWLLGNCFTVLVSVLMFESKAAPSRAPMMTKQAWGLRLKLAIAAASAPV